MAAIPDLVPIAKKVLQLCDTTGPKDYAMENYCAIEHNDWVRLRTPLADVWILKWPNCEAHSRVQGRATGVDVISPGNRIDISYVYSK